MDTHQWIFHTLPLILILNVCLTSGQYSEDSCNWMLWDGAEDARGIRNVQSACAEGTIQWKNPYGAIRLIFTQYQAAFEICFIAHSSQVHIKISSENKKGLKHVLLLTPEASETDDEICINSPHGDDVVLFVESIWIESSAVGFLNIDYDVRRSTSSLDDYRYKQEDCRPCTNQETQRIVCSADFVVKGTMRHVETFEHRQETEVHLSLTKLYKQLHTVFSPYSDQQSTVKYVTKQSRDTMPAIEKSRDTTSAIKQSRSFNQNSITKQLKMPTHSGKVIIPQKCNTQKGDGEFIFMGKIRLKKAYLSCALRTEDFERIWTDAVRNRKNRCNL